MEKIKNLFKGKKKLLTIPVVGLLGLFFLPITILLLIGWLIYAKVSNKKVKIAGLGVVGLFILFFGSAYVSAIVSPTPPKQETKVESAQTESTPSPTPTQKPENLVKITRVIDGDTVELEGGKRLRLIGIDSPEKGDCYSQEATNKASELLESQEVTLEKDVSETDRYGRLLRYIWKGETLINEQLVKEGYASSYSYPPDVKYQDRIVAAQKEARDNNRGLWSACNSQTSNTNTQPASTPSVKPSVKTNTTQPSSGGACKYSCSSPDRDCSDFSTHAEAQTFFNCCGFTASYDPMRLDKATGQGNGLACESLP